MSDTTIRKIAELNDLCRKAMGIGGKLLQTEGICALPQADNDNLRSEFEAYKAAHP